MKPIPAGVGFFLVQRDVLREGEPLMALMGTDNTDKENMDEMLKLVCRVLISRHFPSSVFISS
jgi:hypothetical protein